MTNERGSLLVELILTLSITTILSTTLVLALHTVSTHTHRLTHQSTQLTHAKNTFETLLSNPSHHDPSITTTTLSPTLKKHTIPITPHHHLSLILTDPNNEH